MDVHDCSTALLSILSKGRSGLRRWPESIDPLSLNTADRHYLPVAPICVYVELARALAGQCVELRAIEFRGEYAPLRPTTIPPLAYIAS